MAKRKETIHDFLNNIKEEWNKQLSEISFSYIDEGTFQIYLCPQLSLILYIKYGGAQKFWGAKLKSLENFKLLSEKSKICPCLVLLLSSTSGYFIPVEEIPRLIRDLSISKDGQVKIHEKDLDFLWRFTNVGHVIDKVQRITNYQYKKEDELELNKKTMTLIIDNFPRVIERLKEIKEKGGDE